MSEFGQRIAQPGEDFRVADRLEIMDLMWRFAAAIDIGDLAMFESCFTDPLMWDLSDNPVCWTGGPADLGPREFARSEFMAIVRGRDAGKLQRPPGVRQPVRQFTQHGVLNPIITFTGPDSATALAYNHEHMHRWLVDAPDREEVETLDIGGFYHNDVRRVGDRWRISYLRLKIRFYDPDRLFSLHAKRARGAAAAGQ